MFGKTDNSLSRTITATVFLFTVTLSLHSQVKKDTTQLNLKEVQVTSQNTAKIQQTTVPMQVIGKTDISRLGVQSMADAVRRFAGVVVKDYGGIGGLKTVTVRGFGAQQTAVSVDGITTNDAQSGQIDIGRFALNNVASVSLEIGQSDNIFQPARNFASAAILNIVSQKPAFGEKSYIGNVGLKGGSFGQFNPSFFIASKLKKDLSISLNGDWQHADGNYPFKFDNGASIEHRKRLNSDVDIYRLENNLYKNWGEKGELVFRNSYYDANRGLPGAAISNNIYAAERLITRIFFSQLGAKYRLSHQFLWRAGAKINHSYERYSNTYNNVVVSDRYRQYEYYATSTLLYQPSVRWQFSVAQDFVHNYLYSMYGQSTLDPETYPDRLKAYRNASITALNAHYGTEKVTLQVGLLGAYYSDDLDKGTAAKDKKRISPSASLSYNISSDWMTRISYKDIYRVPTLNDTYYTQIGNTALKPEIARQFNLGTTFKHNTADDMLALSFDGYYNQVKDKIVARMKMFNAKMENVDNVRILGIDMKAVYEKNLNKKMRLYFSGTYSYQDAEDTDLKQQIIYTPEHSGNGSIALENPWVNISYSVTVCGSEWSQQYHTDLNKIDAYADQSVSLNKTFKFNAQELRVQLDLLNLSNKNYEIIKGYPMPGRSFVASGIWKF